MGGSSRQHTSPSTERVNIISRLIEKTGVHFKMVMVSLKGALPPIIAIAAYQAPAWARIYSTSGYFVAIIALLSMLMQPRAKFFQSMFTNAIFISVTTSLNLLVILCAVSARNAMNNRGLHSGSSGSVEATPYDSSSNAVAATGLFFIVFFTNFLKAKRPQLAIPAIQSNIYSITAAIYAPSFPNMTSGMDFTRRLLNSFLTAYCIAAAVNVLICPTTSRGDVKRQSVSLICSLKECLQICESYTDSLDASTETEEDSMNPVEIIKKLKDRTQETSGQFGKIKLGPDFACKEVAYGFLRPGHLHEFYVGT